MFNESYRDILMFFLFCFAVIFATSLIMITRYLWKRNLIPKWRLLTGFMLPLEGFGAYITNTKKEYGHVGIWFKLFISSFLITMAIGLILAITY